MSYQLHKFTGVTGKNWQNCSICINNMIIYQGIQKSQKRVSSLIKLTRRYIFFYGINAHCCWRRAGRLTQWVSYSRLNDCSTINVSSWVNILDSHQLVFSLHDVVLNLTCLIKLLINEIKPFIEVDALHEECLYFA